MTNFNLNVYDVILIGAGSVGTPSAYYLSDAGLSVLIIEQHASTGQGSNKSAIGGIRATHSDPAKIRLSLESIDEFANWESRHGYDIEWVQGGYSFVAYTTRQENNLKSLLTEQKSLGLEIDWLNRADLLNRIPHLNPNELIGGTYSPGDGSASPLKSNYSYFAHARSLGADFHFNETVTSIEPAARNRIQVTTNRDTYLGDVVINCAGAWAKQVAAMIDTSLPIEPDSHEAGVTEPVRRFLDPMIVDTRPTKDSANFYFYQHKTGQIIFCITPSPNQWGYDTRETSSFLPSVSRRMLEVMPILKSVKVRRTWRGLYPMTPDGSPLIGWEPSLPGMLIAAGMCGQGFMLGPGVGKLITRLITQNLTTDDQDTLRQLNPYRTSKGAERLA